MKTVIIGASNNPERAACQAAELLRSKGHEFIPVGIREGVVAGQHIISKEKLSEVTGVDTVTLYIRADLQPEWYDVIFALHPRRIIFNPGTENPEFAALAKEKGISADFACSLVLLSTGQY
jgi:uncharacterized protein